MRDEVNATEAKALPTRDALPARAGEAALVAHARQGDAAAFEELYVAYRDQTYNLCLSLCADRDEAQDLLQETFVRAYRYLPRFRGDAHFATWLHRITVNLCHDARRRKQRQAALLAAPASPERTPAEAEAVEQVRAALARLQPNYRLVLALRYSQTLSYQEIADLLHWSLGRVKITLHRAKLAFRDVYVRCESES